MVKRTSIIVAVLMLGLLFWLSVEPWATDPTLTLSSYHYWLWPMVLLVVLASAVAISFMIIPENRLKVIISIGLGFEYILVFGLGKFLFVGFGLLIWGHWMAIRNIAGEMTERHKISASSTVRRGMTAIIFPILILISFAYYETPALQTMAEEGKLPSQISKAVEKTVPKLLAFQKGTVDKAQISFLEKRYIKEVNDQINKELAPHLAIVPPILAFGLFLVLQSLNIIFFNLASWLSMLLYFILKMTGFIKIGKKQVEAEVLEI